MTEYKCQTCSQTFTMSADSWAWHRLVEHPRMGLPVHDPRPHHPEGDRPEAEYIGRCPACGDPIDYCQGHGITGDPNGARILAMHDEDYSHIHCHPAGCDAARERTLARAAMREFD